MERALQIPRTQMERVNSRLEKIEGLLEKLPPVIYENPPQQRGAGRVAGARAKRVPGRPARGAERGVAARDAERPAA